MAAPTDRPGSALPVREPPYTRLLQRLTAPAAILDPTGQVLAVNPALARLVGTTEDRLCHSAFEEWVAPEHRATYRLLLRERPDPQMGEVRLATEETRYAKLMVRRT